MGTESLQRLSEELNLPGAPILYNEAWKRKLQVTRQQVQRLVARQGERQVFQPAPVSKGKSASERYPARYQADLGDMTANPYGDYKFFLLLINVFSCQAYVRVLRSTSPGEVAEALRELLLPLDVNVLSTDEGKEFQQQVGRLLDEQDIAHRAHVGRENKNSLTVLDGAMQNIKQALSRRLARQNTDDWPSMLPQVVRSYNEQYHSSVYDAPNDDKREPVLEFMLLRDIANKLQHHQTLHIQREAQLAQQGAFRRPEAMRKRTRSFQATYGAIERPLGVQTGMLQAERGNVHIKNVLVVPSDSTDVEPRLQAGEARREQKRAQVRDLVIDLREWLQSKGGRASCTAAETEARMLGTSPVLKGKVATMKPLFGSFPELFQAQGNYVQTR